jgi:lysophospholipase L1-like esterase
MLTKRLLVIYLLLLHLALGFLLLKTNFIEKAKQRLGFPKSELTQHYHSMVSYQRRMDSHVPENSVIFIGDSVTQSLTVSAVSDKAVNYGIGSDTTAGVLERVPYYQSLRSAKAVVLAIGTNDLKRRGDREIIENYKSTLDILGDDIQIVICAILPVDEKIERRVGLNNRIQAINHSLLTLIREHPSSTFINPGDDLVGQDGNLSSSYHTGDGLHLNAQGNKILIKSLKQTLAL